MQLKKEDRQLGYYRELLEHIYNSCELLHFYIKTTPFFWITPLNNKRKEIENIFHEGIKILVKHGIDVEEILSREYPRK